MTSRPSISFAPNETRAERGAMHERLDRDERIRGSSDRAFGLMVGVAAFAIGLVPLFSVARQASWWLMGAGAVLVTLGLAFPAFVHPLNVAWLWFSQLLFNVISPIFLALLFYGCVTPLGWLMRATGKDPLRLKFDRSCETYWIPREAKPGSMKNQF